MSLTQILAQDHLTWKHTLISYYQVKLTCQSIGGSPMTHNQNRK
jgi:hypothetical protein